MKAFALALALAAGAVGILVLSGREHSIGKLLSARSAEASASAAPLPPPSWWGCPVTRSSTAPSRSQ